MGRTVHLLSTIFVIVLGISIIKAEVILTHSPNVVFENTAVTLTCQYDGDVGVYSYDWKLNGGGIGTLLYNKINGGCSQFITPNATLYAYSCPEQNRVTLTIIKITQSNNGDEWNCTFSLDNKSSETSDLYTIIVQVPVTSMKIVEPTNATVTVKENTVQVFKCRTSKSRPIPTIKWYLGDGTTTQDTILTDNVQQMPLPNENVLQATTGTLSYRPTRLVNGWQLYCSAQNITSSKKSLNITYLPNDTRIDSYQKDYTYSVIAGKMQTLTCRSIDGNPLATLHWSCFTGSVSSDSTTYKTVTSQWSWTSNTAGQCTCVSVHMFGNQSYSLNINILKAVNNVKFQISNKEVSGNVTVIHDSAVPIVCSASGTPTITYRWTHGTMNVTGDKLLPKDILQDGTYSCSAYNTLKPTLGQQEQQEPHSSTSSVDVIRLYKPVVHALSNVTIEEGRSPNTPVVCQVTPGNPPRTKMMWTRDSKQVSSQNGVTHLQLFLTNVQKSQDGTYNCTAENTMVPTEGKMIVGRDSKQFQLIVFYNTSIVGFEELHLGNTEVTVKENDTTQLNCLTDSKPGSTISITKGQEVKHTGNLTNKLIYTIPRTTCLDTGIYTCVGFNDRIGQVTRPSMDLQLYVKCGPRLSPINKTELNQTSTLNAETTLQVYILVYPPPTQLIWKNKTGDTLPLVKDDRVESNVSTSGIFTRASIIIHNVQQSDFGEYQLHVKHEVYDKNFTLFFNPKDKPSPPTNTGYEKLTVTSAVIYWTTGFNGGFTQTFIIMYRKDDESLWSQKELVDNNEQRMNITLDNLESGSGYIVKIYATNVLGNSSAQSDIEFVTVAVVPPPGPPAALIGGAVAGSVLFIAVPVVLVILFLRGKQIFKGKSASDVELSKRPVAESDDDDDDDDGMKPNPMYVTSAAVGGAAGGAAGHNDVYATPIKKGKTAAGVQNSDIYAQVQKKNKTAKKKEKKGKSNGNNKGGQMGDVYENVQPITGQKASTNDNTYENPVMHGKSEEPKKKNVNKDGLIYADLAFNDKQKGQKKLVIIGSDDRTPYAQVDFTKKADPLPDSDDEK